MLITLQDLESEKSQQNLKKLKNQTTDRMRIFFTRHLAETIDATYREHGLATYILRQLNDSPFEESQVSDRTIRRWVNGETMINRFAAYQICIAFKWGSSVFEEFFTHLGLDYVRFNDWREVLYFYCIEKEYCLNKSFELYQQCKDIGLDEGTGTSDKGQPTVTILTAVIKDAYELENFKDDTEFINYMEEQRDKFHKIKNTRRQEIAEYLQKIKQNLKGVQGTVPDLFASAFFEDDEDNNLKYFSNAITAIKKRRSNFSREFFILCLLISGKNNADEIKAILTSERRDYSDLDPLHNLFDACVYEACKYYEHHAKSNPNITAYNRFRENTIYLEFKRPSQFAYD